MTLLLGGLVPDFTADTTTGPIAFRDWMSNDWAFFFNHPASFTSVCTTEMGRAAHLSAEFKTRNVNPLGLSTDTVEEHLKWIDDVNDTQNTTLPLQIVADPDLKIAKLFEMIHPAQSETAAVRSVIIIDPQKTPTDHDVPNEHGAQFRRDPACHRRLADWRCQGLGPAGRLAPRRIRHHTAKPVRCRGRGEIPARGRNPLPVSAHGGHIARHTTRDCKIITPTNSQEKTLLALLAVLGFSAPSQAEEVPSPVTILASGEPQTQLMSIVLTMQSMQQGSSVHVLLRGPARDLALKEAPASAIAPQKPRDISPQGLMQEMMDSGATVEVCAIYLSNKGVGPEALLYGISAAKPPEMVARLLAPETRIMLF